VAARAGAGGCGPRAGAATDLDADAAARTGAGGAPGALPCYGFSRSGFPRSGFSAAPARGGRPPRTGG